MGKVEERIGRILDRRALVVSCEHGGNRIPRPWAGRLVVPAEVLASHRGHDPGSVTVARVLAGWAEGAPIVNTVTRLLVDANRSRGHRGLHSEFARALPDALRRRAVETVWAPHREAVEAACAAAIEAHGAVLHVSSHSFTPVLDGEVRDVDVGLLYDPSSPLERTLAEGWSRALAALRPDLRVRRNAPYRGVSDGLTRSLRRALGTERYAGIELEVSQRFRGPAVRAIAAAALASLVTSGRPTSTGNPSSTRRRR